MTALGVGDVKALRLCPDGGETRLRWFNMDVTREMLQQRCAAHLAGRAAEILLLGEASGGAGGTDDSDLHQATLLMLQCHLSLGLGTWDTSLSAHRPRSDAAHAARVHAAEHAA
ncbi:hypothetical protein FLP41_16035 [Paracoccus marcusii]|uniref:hypothetical protein n=1 Tax=Paracoccus marcusii TaxID=59779 RepID=UPI002ED2CE63|nr:hypothetical protein FLP41_16035 [Paracoccus marcusii]